MSYILKRTLDVFKFRFRLSEFVDSLVDNIENMVPEDYIKITLETLNDIIDELIWL